jgi:type II secretory pathway component PulF
LAVFAYQALTAAGERVSGEIDAVDARGAIQRLQDGGLIPIEAQPVEVLKLRLPCGKIRSCGAQLSKLLRRICRLPSTTFVAIG